MNSPNDRFTIKALLSTVSALLLIGAGSGVAFAEPVPNSFGYVPPEITFTTGPDSITAQIHNPNRMGICYATIGIGDSMHYFGGAEDAPWPGPGETSAITQAGLEPGEYRGNGFCADDLTSFRRSNASDYSVTVEATPEPPKSLWQRLLTGSAGS